ncbi:MAG TPA: hypothetical protein VHC49_14765 [Mycobacteriales bacterium]|nr:hypothetical protein [Mycobacteriales bacterium]
MPAGYGTPTGLAVDPADDDVWFVAQGPDQKLFHWSHDAGKITDTFSIHGMRAGEFTPITIDTAHRIWLGMNQKLLVLRPGRHDLRQIALPPVKVGSARSGLPNPGIPDFGAHSSIDAIAVGPRGSIVVSRLFATELQTVDASTFAIGTIALPDNTAMPGLGEDDIAGDGRHIAAALYSSTHEHRLGQLHDGAWITASPCGAYAVTIADRYLALSGDKCVAGRKTASAPVKVENIPVTGLPEHSLAGIVSRSLVAVTVPGGLVAATATTQSPLISLGKVAAGSSIGGNGTGDPKKLVPIRPVLMRSGSNNNLYFVPANQRRIGLVHHES